MAVNVLTIGLRGAPSLCIFGKPYSLGGLEPAGRNHLQISSVSVDFLSRSAVFLSIESVGSWVSFLYAASSRSEAIFCL